MAWQEFEAQCTDYLNQKYGKMRNEVRFVQTGGADSTKSDIKVVVGGAAKFYIEVKMSESQCGQFVLLPDMDSRKYRFSSRNNSTETVATREIIAYMNRNFDQFLNGGSLVMEKEVFYRWVQEHYEKMGVKYVMTREDGYTILPLEKFAEYFEIKATYRVKRSGSRSPTESQQKEVIEYLKKYVKGYAENGSQKLVGRDLVVTGENLVEKQRFVIGERTYYLAKCSDGYRVRVLSKTENRNVIFGISLKKREQGAEDLAQFEKEIEQV